MAITAEFIGVYIAGIIITTATITVIGATITAIIAIGETYPVAAVSKTSSPQAQGLQHSLGAPTIAGRCERKVRYCSPPAASSMLRPRALR